MKWWQKTVVYECYPKSFLDTKGQGTGTIRGIIEKLDDLKKLGVGAIWLTPVYRSPMKDNGYDVADYYDIDPSFGTMTDMEELILQAKKREIGIVMDLVLNHTSDQNAWFQKSKQSEDNPKSDWYIWRDAKADGSAPANWRSIFGGSAWTWCEERKQYYLHTFASCQPDLNWKNPEVRKEASRIAEYWIDKGVDGFRIDAITYIRKPDIFEDGPVDGEDGLSSIHPLTANQPGILDYLKEFRSGIPEKGNDGREVFMVAEANGVSAEELPQWTGKNGVFDMLLEFSHVDLQFQNGEIWCRPTSWKLTDLKKALNDSEKSTADDGWYPVFFENHDQPRSINHYFHDDQNVVEKAKVLGMILYTMRGTPFLYQGEELGYTNVKWHSINDYDDISSHGQYAFALKEGCTEKEALQCVHDWSRDNARTPMQWDDSENAGFTTGKPWLPVHQNYRDQNAEKESEDPDSVLSWYRKLTKIRKQEPALTEGDYEPVLEEEDSILGFYRRKENETVLVLTNFTDRDVDYDVSLSAGMECILSNETYKEGILHPYQAVLLKKNNP